MARLGCRSIVGGLLGLATVSGASASVVSYQGTCGPDAGIFACNSIGLSIGDSVSAVLDLNTPGPDFANLLLGKADVNSFSIAIGAVSFTAADTTNWDFELSTNGAGAVTSFQLLASLGGTIDYLSMGETVDLRLGNWFASTDAACGLPTNTPCDFAETRVFGANAGTVAQGVVRSITLAAVPEPASLALLGLGLAALGWSRRKK